MLALVLFTCSLNVICNVISYFYLYQHLEPIYIACFVIGANERGFSLARRNEKLQEENILRRLDCQCFLEGGF